MDPIRPEHRAGERPDRVADRPPLIRPSRLARPVRFDPPHLVDRSRRTVSLDEHSRQLADALAAARREGIEAARAEIEEAVNGHREAQRRLDAAAAMLVEAVRQLAARDADVVADLESQAISLGVELAESLIGRELETCDDVVVGTIATAMNLVPDRGSVVVRVHPDDATVASETAVARHAVTRQVDIVADPSVGRGGCIVVLEPLRIDAQIGPALDRVRAALQP